MTKLEEIKQIANNEIQLTDNTVEKILEKNPSQKLLEKIGDQALVSYLTEKRIEFDGDDTLYGVFSTYEQMAQASKLLRASICFRIALKKRSTPTKTKNPPKKKTSKKAISNKSKAKTNRPKARSKPIYN